MTKSLTWAALCAALIGASCAAPEPPQPAPKVPRAAEAAPFTAAKKTPARAPEAEGEDPAAPDQAALSRPKPKPPPRIKPSDLIGLTDRELTKVLGRPSFKRVDDPAALWQYREARCILDLFLYADGPAYRVTHLEIRKRGGAVSGDLGGAINGKDAERCFSNLVPKAKAKG